MATVEETERENEMLRERLSKLSEACLRINESLEFKTVMQEVLDSARALTGSRYGVITIFDEERNVQDFLASGMTREQGQQLWEIPGAMQYFELLREIQDPLRLRDFQSHIRSMGLPDFRAPMPVSEALTFLASPVRYGGESVANIYVGEKEGGRSFTREDEEILVMFASQAALVIANARRYRDEQRARSGLETLINTSPVGVVVFDAKTGASTSINREARRFLRPLRMPDQTLQDLLGVMTVRRSDGREFCWEEPAVAQAMKMGEVVRAEEVVLNVPDGREVSALLNATPIHDNDGSVESYVVTLQDMAPLEELERLRADFLAMVSHELRTPLAAVKGSTTTVLKDASSRGTAEMVQFFNIINQQADQMSDLIDDLLDVARIETGTLQIRPEPVSVTELVDEARRAVQTGRQRNNMRIELSPDLLPVMADRRRIVQVLSNLLSNATRHSPEASPIRVTAVQDGAYMTVCVADQGMGVSADRLPHLFRKFGRLDSADRAGTDSGSGWGLSICRGIVEAHGGRIWAESDGAGMGTRITFSCPIAEKPVNTTSIRYETTTEQRPATRDSRVPIMVVDDDPQTLRAVWDALSKAGYLPVVTGNPDEVPGLMEKHRPSLVVMDLVLPGTDGVEVMAAIFDKNDVPVIFLSAYGHEEAITRALDAGAVDYIVKPFSPTELAARIRVALRGRTASVPVVPGVPFVMGDLVIDYAARRVSVAERPVPLTDIEYRLLVEFSDNAGKIVTYEYLLQRVWEKWEADDIRQLRTAVKNLRQKLADDATNPTYIFTERRVGYRLGAAV